MGAKKGNKNGRGAKGRSGRKSAYQEKADAARLFDLFTRKFTKAELTALSKKRNVPLDLLERMVIAAHNGRQQTAIAIFNRIYPEHIKLDDSEVIHRFVLD